MSHPQLQFPLRVCLRRVLKGELLRSKPKATYSRLEMVPPPAALARWSSAQANT